jgi:hypothetical protein
VKVDVNQKDRWGNSPLIDAMQNRHDAIVKYEDRLVFYLFGGLAKSSVVVDDVVFVVVMMMMMLLLMLYLVIYFVVFVLLLLLLLNCRLLRETGAKLANNLSTAHELCNAAKEVRRNAKSKIVFVCLFVCLFVFFFRVVVFFSLPQGVRFILYNDVAGLHRLFEAGAELNIEDYDARTPLHVAAAAGTKKLDCVFLCLLCYSLAFFVSFFTLLLFISTLLLCWCFKSSRLFFDYKCPISI